MPARLKRAGLPYLLLLPGLGWLLIFFVIPLAYMAFESLKSGTLEDEEVSVTELVTPSVPGSNPMPTSFMR